jgi:NAD(P)-dependent dehydrogenase (short-subunit alcohol dehydrogenase family)
MHELDGQMSLKPLENKVIVVAGAAGILGRHFIRGIAESGGIVIASDIDIDAVKSIAKNYPSRIVPAYLDITDNASIEALIHEISIQHGPIYGLVNGAYPRNKNFGRKLEDVTYLDFCQNLNIHLGGYFLVAQKFCLKFKEQGFGNIVNVSSVYGQIPPRFEIYRGTSMTMPVEYAAINAILCSIFQRNGY